MSLGDLGNFGELISALAVVVSVAYLAIQIRQNSKQTRLANVQRMLDASKDMMLLNSNAEYTDLRSREMSDAASLSEEDRFRMRGLRMAQLRNIETAYILNREGVLDAEIFDIFARRAEFILREDASLLERALHSESFRKWLTQLAHRSESGGT